VRSSIVAVLFRFCWSGGLDYDRIETPQIR